MVIKPKMEATTQYLGTRFSTNRLQIFIALPKLDAAHLGINITGPYCTVMHPAEIAGLVLSFTPLLSLNYVPCCPPG
jgi:hypothetical protein